MSNYLKYTRVTPLALHHAQHMNWTVSAAGLLAHWKMFGMQNMEVFVACYQRTNWKSEVQGHIMFPGCHVMTWVFREGHRHTINLWCYVANEIFMTLGLQTEVGLDFMALVSSSCVTLRDLVCWSYTRPFVILSLCHWYSILGMHSMPRFLIMWQMH